MSPLWRPAIHGRMHKHTSTHPAPGSRTLVHRCVRYSIISCIVIVVLLIVVAWVLTRSWFLIGRITPELERRLGGQVSIASATLQWNGQVVLRDFQLRSPSHMGTAGEIARIGQAVIALDRSALLSGDIIVLAIELDDVLLRMSEDANDIGSFSFSALKTDWTEEDAERALPPRIEITRATLEYGTFDGEAYTMSGQRLVAGIMHPAVDEEHWFNFQLGELSTSSGSSVDGLIINGRWNVMTNEYSARMDGMELDAATYRMCPQLAQTWWQHMELEGRLASATVHWHPENGLDVASKILDVGLTLPVEAGEWARYTHGRISGMSGRQRMRVYSGWIRLRDDELILDGLEGEVQSPDDATSVPYIVTMTLPRLPELDFQRERWTEDVRDYTPFTVKFSLPEFRLAADDETGVSAIDLPYRVARILEQFQITDWTLTTSIEVSRAAPVQDDTGTPHAQPIETRGELRITNASGSFERFQYPLDDVDAHLTFDQDRVDVRHVTGTAANGVAVRLSGEITPLGRNPRIDLQLVADDVPIDDLLRNALPREHMAVFDGLMHVPSEQKLRNAGLLRDEADLEQLHARVETIEADLAITEDATRQNELEMELRQVRSMIEAGAFELGGRVDLNVNILRPYGPDQPTLLSGEVSVRRLDAIIQYFPYPFSIRGGVIRWHPDGAKLVGDDSGDGMPVITQGGGRGYISGDFTRDQLEGRNDRITPNIDINVQDDLVSELVYAAIPAHSDDEEVVVEHNGITYSPAAGLLRGIGLAGMMNYTGSIHGNTDGQVGYEFHVHMEGGTAEPSDDLADALGSAGLVWPSQWTWDDVNVHVRVSPRAVELIGFSGQREQGQVSATGVIDLRSDSADASLDVRFKELALDRYLIDLFPPERVKAIRELWDRYQPTGHFNAHLQYHRRSDVTHPPLLHIEPALATLNIGGEPMTFKRKRGGMTVRTNAIVFDDLRIAMSQGDVDHGSATLRGVFDASNDNGNELRIDGALHDSHFESPAIAEALRLFGADRQHEQLQQWQVAGVFDASFAYESRAEQDALFNVMLHPKTLAATLDKHSIELEINRGATVKIEPGLIMLEEVAGRHAEGRFAVDGWVRNEDRAEAAMDFSYSGPMTSALAQALLPRGMRDVMGEVQYKDGPESRVSDARLRLVQNHETDDWHVDFRGRLHTDNASFNGGMDVDEMTGDFDVVVSSEPGEPLGLTVDAHIDRMRVMQRELTDVSALNIRLSQDGTLLLLDEVQAKAYGGALWANARIGVDSNVSYSAEAHIVGVSLRGLADDAEGDSRGRGPRGELYGSVKFAGERGKPEQRSGRGTMRAVDGSLANVPLILQLAQIMQLTVPLRGELDHADIVFFIDGDRAVFERILLESTIGSAAALQLFGSGELNLRTFELDTRFRSRSGMLLIRDLVGGLSDQLYMIEVTGTLASPRARVVPLPGLTQPSRTRQQSQAGAMRELSR